MALHYLTPQGELTRTEAVDYLDRMLRYGWCPYCACALDQRANHNNATNTDLAIVCPNPNCSHLYQLA